MTATVNAPAQARAAGNRKTSVALGAVPRVSLMPPELGERNRQLGVQRGLRLLMFAAVVLAIGATAGAWYLAFGATLAAQAEQARTADLLLQQQQYAEVQQAIRAVELGEAALRVGGSTEIDWQDYLGRVQASLPEGVLLESFTVDASTVTEQYPQSSIPLQGNRIATLQFSAKSSTLPEIPDWLNRLQGLPGFVDANPGSVSRGVDGSYTASIEMHIDAQAYSNRLTADEAEAAETEEVGE
ncbi:hypothetical protein H4J02_01645 [Protaetiibacter sp. SSC-01]|uniref:hypothetical protein n=1 Tax=Protaetiibacter sp. SSC-01 TaxID=2759943 RepID=UPI001656F612|nr:hypothetical protein [Protaetiibacter sp. SSC-01]QNO37772.1 hypothetical protein H4J02_01645 [Protaetiibacter sp. SSC-01]